jgi:hypothetical protein
MDFIPSNLASDYGLGKHDQIRSNIDNKGNYFAVPSHPWKFIKRDLREAQASKLQRLSLLEISTSQPFDVQNVQQITPDARIAPGQR